MTDDEMDRLLSLCYLGRVDLHGSSLYASLTTHIALLDIIPALVIQSSWSLPRDVTVPQGLYLASFLIPAFCIPSLIILLECYGLDASGRLLLFCVRFFLPGVFFLVRVTWMGSGVLVRTSSSTSY